MLSNYAYFDVCRDRHRVTRSEKLPEAERDYEVVSLMLASYRCIISSGNLICFADIGFVNAAEGR